MESPVWLDPVILPVTHSSRYRMAMIEPYSLETPCIARLSLPTWTGNASATCTKTSLAKLERSTYPNLTQVAILLLGVTSRAFKPAACYRDNGRKASRGKARALANVI